MAYCPKCGQAHREGDRFCGKCGYDLMADATSAVPFGGQEHPSSGTRRRQLLPIVLVAGAALIALAFVVVRTLGGGAGGGDHDGGVEGGESGYVLISDTFDDDNYYAEVDEVHYAADEATGAQFVDNELLVFSQDGVAPEEVEAAVATVGGTVVGRIEAMDEYQVRIEGARSFSEEIELCSVLMDQAVVFAAYPHFLTSVSTAAETQDDIWTETDWKGPSTGAEASWAYRDIHLSEAWDALDTEGIVPGDGVTVGILDNYFFLEHQELLGSLEGCSPYDPTVLLQSRDDHGTHVAGTIVAHADDGGSVGVAYGSKAVGYAVGNNPKVETDISLHNALSVLVKDKGARVINISLEFEDEDPPQPGTILEGWLTRTALYELAQSNDYLICKSADNRNNDSFEGADAGANRYNGLPYESDARAAYTYIETASFAGYSEKLPDVSSIADRLLVVGAYEFDPTLESSPDVPSRYVASYSDGGDAVTIVAPGTDILSTTFSFPSDDVGATTIESNHSYKYGTSMATPMVSGVAALVLSANPQLTGPEVKKILVETTTSTCGYDCPARYAWVKYYDEENEEDVEGLVDTANEEFMKEHADDVKQGPLVDRERITAFSRLDGYPMLNADTAVRVALASQSPTMSVDDAIASVMGPRITYTWAHGVPDGMELDQGVEEPDIWYPVFSAAHPSDGVGAAVRRMNEDALQQVQQAVTYHNSFSAAPIVGVILYPEVTYQSTSYLAVHYYCSYYAGTKGTFYIAGIGSLYRLSDGAEVSPAELLGIDESDLLGRAQDAVDASDVGNRAFMSEPLGDMLTDGYADYVVLPDGVYVYLQGVSSDRVTRTFHLVGICDLEGGDGSVKGTLIDLSDVEQYNHYKDVDRSQQEGD